MGFQQVNKIWCDSCHLEVKQRHELTEVTVQKQLKGDNPAEWYGYAARRLELCDQCLSVVEEKIKMIFKDWDGK